MNLAQVLKLVEAIEILATRAQFQGAVEQTNLLSTECNFLSRSTGTLQAEIR